MAGLGVVRVLRPDPLFAAPRLPDPFLAADRTNGPAQRGPEDFRPADRRALRHDRLLLVLVCAHPSASLCCYSCAAGPVEGLVVSSRDRTASVGLPEPVSTTDSAAGRRVGPAA